MLKIRNVMQRKISLIFGWSFFDDKKSTSVRTKMLFNNIRGCYNWLDDFQVSYKNTPVFTLLVS